MTNGRLEDILFDLTVVVKAELTAIEAKPESLQTSVEWANLNKLTTAVHKLGEVLR